MAWQLNALDFGPRRIRALSENEFKAALEFVNEAVTEEGNSLTPSTGIGTTVSAIVFNGASVLVGHVGDSSAFLFRKQGAGKLTMIILSHRKFTTNLGQMMRCLVFQNTITIP